MTNPTNWPNPERPGEPPNSERDGLYAMRIDEKFIVRYWSTARQHYSLVPGWDKGMSPFDASVFTFCGEILTPAQINEMLAAERERIKSMVVRACNLGNIITASQRDMIIAGIDSETAIRNLGAAP